MALPTLSHAVALPYIADNDAPDDPNIFTLGEIASVLADSVAVSSITSGVTSAAASGALDSVPVSTADSKGVSAASRASIADSKAVSVSGNTSVADSKAVSVSANTSIADSKAVSNASAIDARMEHRFYETLAGEDGVIDTSYEWGDVRRYGAIGDDITDDTTAVRATMAACAAINRNALLPPLSFKITDQITVPAGVNVFAHGATLRWTAFGATIATTTAARAATGNGVRLNSNTGWYGGTLQMDSVTSPSNVSIQAADMSGAFWCLLMIGHFNTLTTSTMSTYTEGVVVEDVKLELLNGTMNELWEIMGATRNVRLRNIACVKTSSTVSATAQVMGEITWGGATGTTYHPHDIQVNNIRMVGLNDTGDEVRGIHCSGAYDVMFRDVFAKDMRFPFSWYIGDPGDPIDGGGDTGTGGVPGTDQRGKICTGLVLDGYHAENFDIGLRVIGDGNGSSHFARRSHAVRAVCSNMNIIGQGASATLTGLWTSNYGIYIDRAHEATLSHFRITECFEGISFATPPTAALSVSALTRSGTTATATAVAHGLRTGDLVVIAGATQDDYNGVHIATHFDADNFTFTVLNSPTTPATGTIACGRFAPQRGIKVMDGRIHRISRNGVGSGDLDSCTFARNEIYDCKRNSVLSTAAALRIQGRRGLIEGNILGAGPNELAAYNIHIAAASQVRGEYIIARGNQFRGAATSAVAIQSGELYLVQPEQVSTDRGDASVTLVAGTDEEIQRYATTLTANRTVTLSATSVYNGARFRVVRTGLGSFTLDVGGLKTIPSATAAFVDVEHDGTSWRLVGYGTL